MALYCVSAHHYFLSGLLLGSTFYQLLKGPPPFPEKKIFFFRFFDFHFQRCIRVYSIRAVKIRSLSSRIVREKSNCRRGVHPKNFFFNILSFSQNRFLSNRKRFSPFFSKTAGPIRLKIFYT